MLDGVIRTSYRRWAENAPWKEEDPFFVEHDLTTITSEYGQNKRICSLASMEADETTFCDEYDMARISRLSWAIATTIR